MPMNLHISIEHIFWLLVIITFLQALQLLFYLLYPNRINIKQPNLSIVISCIALLISIIALATDFKCNGELLVATLSANVALLIGWQIWKSVEWNKKMERIDILSDAHNHFVSRIEKEIHDDFSELILTMMGKGLHDNNYLYIYHKLKALTIGSMRGNFEYCNKIVNDIMIFTKEKTITMNKYEKKGIESLAKNIQNKDYIYDLGTLDTIINNIKISE